MKETTMKEFYWVGSNGEDPERIYFTSADALASEHRYLDSFDRDGKHTSSYKLVDDRYITDF